MSAIAEGAQVKVKVGGRWLRARATGRACYVSKSKARERRHFTRETARECPGGCFWYEVQVEGIQRGRPSSWAGCRLIPEGRLRA